MLLATHGFKREARKESVDDDVRKVDETFRPEVFDEFHFRPQSVEEYVEALATNISEHNFICWMHHCICAFHVISTLDKAVSFWLLPGQLQSYYYDLIITISYYYYYLI